MLEKEGARIMLEELTPDSRVWKLGKLEYPFGRGIHFQIEIADVDRLYKIFKENKYPIFWEMEEKWYRKNDIQVGNRKFWVQDPDGYMLRFYTDIGRRKNN